MYRGEGTLQFTCYYPYAHTPNWTWQYDLEGDIIQIPCDGRLVSNYSEEIYVTKEEWENTLYGAVSIDSYYYNNGEIPTPFIATGTIEDADSDDPGRYPKLSYLSEGRQNIVTIKIKGDYVGPWKWDSRLGLVTGVDSNGKTIPLLYEGNACAALPNDAAYAKVENMETFDYEYWYY